MRYRGSIAGPLILIGVGVVFLLHTIAPDFSIPDLIGHYWPYLLIVWGSIHLIEVCLRASRGGPLPANGISGGTWALVVLVCFVGLGAYEFHRPDNWWRRAGFQRSVEVFGDEHDYPFEAQRRNAGKAPHIVIEGFRGNARIVGRDTEVVEVSGHKTIRALEASDADRGNQQTPVQVTMSGTSVVIRCLQNPNGPPMKISTDLEISVPRNASVEATGRTGDFDISALSGNVDITSENAGVRLQDIGGSVRVDTRRGDIVRCVNVKGPVDLRGHGTDIELEKIAGQVTISGEYTGSISLRDVSKPLRIESMQTELNVQQLPGELKLERGNLTAQNLVGPVQVTTRATDVDINGFSEGLELTVEKGDVDLKPSRLPVGKMVVRTRSGNIDIAMPQLAKFALNASTDRGDIENEFGDELKSRTQGKGARLEGNVGAGPDVSLTTDRGTITVRKSQAAAAPSEAAPKASESKKMPIGQKIEL